MLVVVGAGIERGHSSWIFFFENQSEYSMANKLYYSIVNRIPDDIRKGLLQPVTE